MNTCPLKNAAYGATLLVFWAAAGFSQQPAAPSPANKPTTYPAWWFQRGVIKRILPIEASPAWPGSYPPVADFAACNQGQLKAFAVAAFLEMETVLASSGGAGQSVRDLVQQWCEFDPATGAMQWANGQPVPKVGAGTEDFSAVNLGQLKRVTKLYYERLMQVHFMHAYPWNAPGAEVADFAMANLGQAKAIFSFDLTADSDGDGLPDLWEKCCFNGSLAHTGTEDADGDGFSNREEFVFGLMPTVADTATDTVDLTYDGLNRLTNAGASTYSYDEEGNILSAQP